MLKKYILYSLGIILFYTITACEKPPKPPTTNIQLKIIDANVSEDEKKRGIANIQKRLESVGAKNIIITEQKDQKVTFNYEGNIKPQTFKKTFSVTGKLEFFEVCKEREILYTYLRKIYGSQIEDDELLTTSSEEVKSIDDVLGITITSHPNDPVFAFLPKENKEKVTEMLLQKEPIFVSKLKKRVKFLLGTKSSKGNYELYAVYVTSENKAPLDGSYVTDAEAGYDQAGRHIINIQMDTNGGYIWERLTENAYQNRGNIAVVIDDCVHVAPSVSTGRITGGMTQVSGDFSKEQTEMLANAIRSGSVPKMEIIKIEIVSETTSKK